MDWIAAQHLDVTGLRRGRLFRKYFLLILALVCGALLISGAIGLYFSYQENQRALAVLQREKAVAAAARVEQFLTQIEQQLRFAAFTQYNVESAEQRRVEFLKLIRVARAITDVARIDSRGREEVSVSRLRMDETEKYADRSQDPAFKNARPGQTWFGPVYFRKETEPYMSIALRSGGESGPVTVAEVNLKFIWDVVTRIRVGQKGKAYVVDAAGFLIADPDIGLVLRKTNLANLDQVKAALAPDQDDVLAVVAHDLGGQKVLAAHAPIELQNEDDGHKRDRLGWKVLVEQPVSEVYAGLQATVMRTGGLIVAGLLFSVLAAMWLAGNMVRPIRTLQEGAARIGAGDLETQIEVRTRDELQSLAEQFNSMTAQLRESYAGLERKVEERTKELQETLGQQTATAEILKVISSSTTDVQPVFEAIVHSAARLFEPWNAAIVMREGERLMRKAIAGLRWRVGVEELNKTFPMSTNPDENFSARAVLERRTIEVSDTEALGLEQTRQSARTSGYRSAVVVPLIREGEAIGTFVLTHHDPGHKLNDKQLALLRTFADQAVIAIENVRLFNETRESLDRQTAISEVLRTISDSQTDVRPVLDAVAERATRLCDAVAATIYVLEGETLRRTAFHGPQALLGGETVPYTPDSLTGRTIAEGKSIHVVDIEQEQRNYPRSWEFAQKFGRHTLLSVPLLREGRPFGTMFLRRSEVRPFSDKQIALSRTFADQAAIGIENVRLLDEIKEKSKQLEVANKHKSDFLANMSHELRTPLNAIIGFSEVLSERMFGELNEKQADYMKDIHESGKHLLSLINDILDLSKIEAGRMDLEISAFHLPSALSNAMTLVRERAQRHGIALGLDVDKRLGEFSADERKFKQIVLNLLSNAVKFSHDGGRVDVSAKLNGKSVEIAVRDTGIGIAHEDQQKVFGEFIQVGRDYTRKAEGTGLGLALTKRFVELHGGEIHLQSAPGKGSTFTFTLPVRQ